MSLALDVAEVPRHAEEIWQVLFGNGGRACEVGRGVVVEHYSDEVGFGWNIALLAKCLIDTLRAILVPC